MKIELNINKVFECDFEKDRFRDFFERVIAGIGYNHTCGLYEKEIAEMFIDAFYNSKVVEK